VALPEQSLRTHDRCPFAPGGLQQFLHPLQELVGEHVICVVPKPLVLQAEVRGFTPLFGPPPSQGLQPVVLHARLLQGGGEAVPVEVGILS
jgi:hypothetical protein